MLEVLDNLKEGCYFLNSRMEFEFINRAAEEIIEKPKEELLGKCLWSALPDYIDTELYHLYNKAFQEQELQYAELQTMYSKSIVEVKVFPNKDGLLCVFSDITKRKEKENEEKYYDKLKIIGEMATGVAHEIRNPMTTVKGFLQLMSKDKELENYDSRLQLMIDELDRANSIIAEFLNLAKNKARKLNKTSINHIITSMYPLLETRALKEGKNIKLQLVQIPNILVDQDEIRQLLLNMINNSLDAMEEKKSVTIITYEEKGAIVLSIDDEGSGIPENIIDNVEIPFVTGKENGTGLGLPICYSIAQRNNAKIDFNTGPSGTTFNIRFRLVK
ncbi:two-component system sensor histidine kinase NtrB [Alkalihalobacterium chitinilyticum]|uniref:histidine kinase n=1 Tax=Alkalihalobacterium chitinilyticum TaxID=2980103 RepID=A0ABT5VGB9_9BACI|nr:ATP-binding protein [Alkalihalobacterium chitinilyticum]MDE5414330.1 ATP-binding protein [Alkalihalobacterium chitinilyticum]